MELIAPALNSFLGVAEVVLIIHLIVGLITLAAATIAALK